jgi:glycosyltransferase involved in cell wall biosynthesis
MEWGLSALLMLISLTRLDLKRRYNLVHVNNMPDFIVFSAMLPRLRGCPVILDIHDPIPELTRSKLNLPESHLLVRVQAFLEKISIRFSSHVLTATPSFKRILVSRGAPAGKITVVMNAADPLIFKPRCDASDIREVEDDFVLLYVGTVAERYGLEICIRALSLLKEEIPGVKLRLFTRILKEGRDLDRLVDLATELGVRGLLEVNGPVPLDEMPQVMKNADVGLYPARRDCHMDVALSLKIPEMVSVGLPIVATRLPILEELFGEDSIAFVPDGCPECFAEKCIELFRDRQYRKRLIQNALGRAGDLSWESQYLAYKEVIEGLLEAKPPARR